MRIAMIHRDLAVPPRAGAHLHTTKIASELVRRGHEIRYFCVDLDQRAPLPFPVERVAPAPEDEGAAWIEEGRLVRSLMRYWATSPGDLLGVARAFERWPSDAVIGCGLHGLIYLRVASARARIWFPADEMGTLTLSQIRWSTPLGRKKAILSEAARFFLFERMSRDIPDQTWMVAEKDSRIMRRILGGRDVAVIQNGVDLDYFSPRLEEPRPNSAVFWGRLDFPPNEQALEFFLERVWPSVRAAQPGASLTVMGFSPSETVRRLANAPGVTLLSDVPDLRPVAGACAVALYPFVSGSGIKNKLLEGAAMGKAMLASPIAVDGLAAAEPPAWRVCRGPQEWRDALLELWRRPETARELGARARLWAETHHSWERAGALAERHLERALSGRSQEPR